MDSIFQGQTSERVSADLATVGMHDGNDGAASVNETLHIPADKFRVGGQIGIGRSRPIYRGKTRNVDFVACGAESKCQFGVMARDMPAAMDEDDGWLSSGNDVSDSALGRDQS